MPFAFRDLDLPSSPFDTLRTRQLAAPVRSLSLLSLRDCVKAALDADRQRDPPKKRRASGG